jgi:hypothetical protein
VLGQFLHQRLVELFVRHARRVRARDQGLTLVPISAQLEPTLPLSAQLEKTLSPTQPK